MYELSISLGHLVKGLQNHPFGTLSRGDLTIAGVVSQYKSPIV